MEEPEPNSGRPSDRNLPFTASTYAAIYADFIKHMDAMDRPEKIKLGQLRKAYARNGLCVLFTVSLCGRALALIIQYPGPKWVHTEVKISLEVCSSQRRGVADCGGGMGYLECIIVMRLPDR